jgi:hypothetical protein
LDRRRNAGASSLVNRTLVRVQAAAPARVTVNLSLKCLDLRTFKLFFLPDIILSLSYGRYGSISYRDIEVEQGVTNFIEDEDVPADATIVGKTWRFVNKDGSPDRRFNNNTQLPVVNYGVLRIRLSTALELHLNTSNAQQSLAFAHCWWELQQRGGYGHVPNEKRHRVPPPKEEIRDALMYSREEALKLFGLTAGVSEVEITQAYHRLALLYHPDKVVGLAPEFQNLAHAKMTEINSAYQLLKG